MKITIFSDVHGNLIALEKFLEKEKDSDFYVFLGDAVNYGPWSNECVMLLESLSNCICLKGNHENYFINGEYDGINPIANSFFDQCYSNFTKRDTILKYSNSAFLYDYNLVHTINDRSIYKDTRLNLTQNYFIGHSHHQFLTESNGYKLYNTGSVGQNRKFINLINYINWFPKNNKVELKSIKYDIGHLIEEMHAQKYPNVCIDYYLGKQLA